MILSNVKIHEAIDDGRLVITPEPLPRFGPSDETPYDTTAVDLRLDAQFSVKKDIGKLVVDLSQGGSIIPTLRTAYDTKQIPDSGYRLKPGEFILAQTMERIHLPPPEDFTGNGIGRPVLAARVEGKSSLARLGLLIHFTAPTIHNGFGPAPIVLEIICMGHVPLMLYPGVPICQLIIEEVAGLPKVEEGGPFRTQTSPTGN